MVECIWIGCCSIEKKTILIYQKKIIDISIFFQALKNIVAMTNKLTNYCIPYLFVALLVQDESG